MSNRRFHTMEGVPHKLSFMFPISGGVQNVPEQCSRDFSGTVFRQRFPEHFSEQVSVELAGKVLWKTVQTSLWRSVSENEFPEKVSRKWATEIATYYSKKNGQL